MQSSFRIPLDKAGKLAGLYEAIVDDKYPELAKLNWTLDSHGYALRKVAGKSIKLHRAIMMLELGHEIPRGYEVDHINGNKLDNRAENLRLCTHADNMKNMSRHSDNRSGFKGISPNKKRWAAQIMVNGKKHHLGTFDTKELAYEAYCKAGRELQGVYFHE